MSVRFNAARARENRIYQVTAKLMGMNAEDGFEIIGRGVIEDPIWEEWRNHELTGAITLSFSFDKRNIRLPMAKLGGALAIDNGQVVTFDDELVIFPKFSVASLFVTSLFDAGLIDTGDYEKLGESLKPLDGLEILLTTKLGGVRPHKIYSGWKINE